MENLPPQGFRSPSSRHAGPTVPKSCASSCVGLTPSLLTSEETKLVAVTTEAKPDLRDPLDLTFVDCLSVLENEPHKQQEVSNLKLPATSTPGNLPRLKRKAKKTSPDAVSFSEDETGGNASGIQKVPYVFLRRLRTRNPRDCFSFEICN